MLAALQAKLGVVNDAVFKAGSLLSENMVNHGKTCFNNLVHVS